MKDSPSPTTNNQQLTTTKTQLLETIAQFSGRLTPERKEKLDRIISQRTRHFTMVLEDLTDPHNISAIIRTSEVFGLQDAHIIEEVTKYQISHAILQGSFKWLNLYRYQKRARCFSDLKAHGYQIAVASTNTDKSFEDIDLSKPTAFYMGSEYKGNHEDTLASADVHFKITQYGLTESMNVSVCAGVIMSKLAYFMEQKGRGNFTLSEMEKLQLTADFYERSADGTGQNSPITRVDFE